MSWTTPKTWQVDELVTAADMNTQFRDNLNALKSPPSAHDDADRSSDYSTNQTGWADVDSTNMRLTITTHGGDVMAHFHGMIEHDTGRVYFDVAVDGVRVAGSDGIIAHRSGGIEHAISFTRLITGLSAGEHTFALQWHVNTGTCTLYAGAGSSGKDTIPQFWVREVS